MKSLKKCKKCGNIMAETVIFISSNNNKGEDPPLAKNEEEKEKQKIWQCIICRYWEEFDSNVINSIKKRI